MASFLSSKICLKKSASHIILLLIMMSSTCATSELEEANLQRYHIYQAKNRCLALIANTAAPEDGGLYCPPVWDDITCWPHFVKAGENATQPCPAYIQGFNPNRKATRSCTADGLWQENPDPDQRTNKSWTDFGDCMKRKNMPSIIEENMPIVIRISTIGYSLSLGTLLVATAIMVLFKRLHCQRNTIHINLFLSFMFRAVISVLRNFVFVRHFALPGDIKRLSDGGVLFIQSGPHWECKLLNTLWYYSLNANYMWIFVEGLYLHTLIFFAVFSQSKRFFKLYILIGWVCPLIFIIIWVMVRIFKDNSLCWNTHGFGYYWILEAPIVSSISVNFFFFLNIVRVLFTKIRDCNTRDPRRYRKLAKSTLVLIPLFGVYYIIFIVLKATKDLKIDVISIYMEMALSSFQGTVVALLFCFLNGEVRGEIMKRWHRHWLRRQSVASGRSSRAFSTTSCYIGKDRASLSLGIPLCDVSCRESKGTSPPQSPVNNNNDSGRFFRKVSSMPKLSTITSSSNKAIPRVSSSSKVTFSCNDSVLEQGFDSYISSPEDSPTKTEGDKVCNGGLQSLRTGEMQTLLFGDSRSNSKDRKTANDSSKQSFKGSNLLNDLRIFKSKVFGLKEGDGSVLPHVQSNTMLPPLSDVEEDPSETPSTVS